MGGPVLLQPVRPDPGEEADAFHGNLPGVLSGRVPGREGVRPGTHRSWLTERQGDGQPSRGQKLNWLMLDLVNTKGGPSRMVLSVPTLNLPSLPAVKDWPVALVIVLDA